MHEHIRDVTRRFAKEGFLRITFEPYAREGGVLHLTDIDAVRKVVDPVPDKRVMADLDAIVAETIFKHVKQKLESKSAVLTFDDETETTNIFLVNDPVLRKLDT